jgi:hypothetical protein
MTATDEFGAHTKAALGVATLIGAIIGFVSLVAFGQLIKVAIVIAERSTESAKSLAELLKETRDFHQRPAAPRKSPGRQPSGTTA